MTEEAVCWWSDWPPSWCGHCQGLCTTSGELIE